MSIIQKIIIKQLEKQDYLMIMQQQRYRKSVNIWVSKAYHNLEERQYILFKQNLKQLVDQINQNNFTLPYQINSAESIQIKRLYWKKLNCIKESKNYRQLMVAIKNVLLSQEMKRFRKVMNQQQNFFMSYFAKIPSNLNTNFSYRVFTLLTKKPYLSCLPTWNIIQTTLKYGFLNVIIDNIQKVKKQVFSQLKFQHLKQKIQSDAKQNFSKNSSGTIFDKLVKIYKFLPAPFFSVSNHLTNRITPMIFEENLNIHWQQQLLKYFFSYFDQFWSQFQNYLSQDANQKQFFNYLRQRKNQLIFKQNHLFQNFRYYCFNIFYKRQKLDTWKIYHLKQIILEQIELHSYYYQAQIVQNRNSLDTENQSHFQHVEKSYQMDIYQQMQKDFIVKCLKSKKFDNQIYFNRDAILFPAILIRKHFYTIQIFYKIKTGIDKQFWREFMDSESFVLLNYSSSKYEQFEYYQAKLGYAFMDVHSSSKVNLSTILFLFKYLLPLIKRLDIRVIKIGE